MAAKRKKSKTVAKKRKCEKCRKPTRAGSGPYFTPEQMRMLMR